MYARLAIALVLLVALIGAYIKGRNDGGKIVTAEYAKRDLKAATDYAQKEREITEKYRAQESSWQQQFVAASRSYQKGLANAETAKLAALAAVDAGTLRLRDPSGNRETCGDNASKTTAGSSGNNGGSGGELSPKLTQFLIGEATRADEIVSQLSACQQILVLERQELPPVPRHQ